MALHAAAVCRVQRLTPRLVRVTLTGLTLAGVLDDGPDQRVKLMLPRVGQAAPVLPDPQDWYGSWLAAPEHVRPVLRSYTVRRLRPHLGELDLDVVLHERPGPGAAWASRAAVGDRVGLYGTYGEHELPVGAAWQLLVADHCALPAAAAVLERRRPGDPPVLALLEVPEPGEQVPVPLAPGVQVRWLHTGGRAPGTATLEALRATVLPDGPGYAWVCGEAGTVRQVRRELVGGHGLPPGAVMFMGYWRRGASLDPA